MPVVAPAMLKRRWSKCVAGLKIAKDSWEVSFSCPYSVQEIQDEKMNTIKAYLYIIQKYAEFIKIALK